MEGQGELLSAPLVKKIKDMRAKQVAEIEGEVVLLWDALTTEAGIYLSDNPDRIPLILALGATHLKMTCPSRKMKKGETHKDDEKIPEFLAQFSLEGGTEREQAALCDLLNKMTLRVHELAFIVKYQSKRKRSEPVLVSFGFLMPASHAYPAGAWLAMGDEDYNEVLVNKQGTNFPSLQELKTNPMARRAVINKEKTNNARSMRAQVRISQTVIMQEASEQGSATVTPPAGDGIAEGTEETTPDDNDGDLDADNTSTAAQESPSDLEPAFCRGVLLRVEANPHLTRANSEPAQHKPDFVEVAMDVKASMKLKSYKSNISAMTTKLCEAVQNTTGGDYLNIGGHYLGLLTDEGSATKAVAAEAKINDLTVDMSDDEDGLCEATGYRFGALAVLQAAIDDTLSYKELTGMKRCMAVSNHGIRKKVKAMPPQLTSSEIALNYFTNEEKVAALTGALMAANAQIAELKDANGDLEREKEHHEEAALDAFLNEQVSGMTPGVEHLEPVFEDLHLQQTPPPPHALQQ